MHKWFINLTNFSENWSKSFLPKNLHFFMAICGRGNVMTDKKGEVCLIDPAVHYGHREVDLAFSTLFGAFPDAFYETYHDVFPLEEDWKQRIGLFNLYPLLVHLLLFGSSYYPDVKRNLEKYL
jgi:protein-ribulosamine 3-kinase